jgi:NhaP-type Na+/H+ or K+/H+ antiporter
MVKKKTNKDEEIYDMSKWVPIKEKKWFKFSWGTWKGVVEIAYSTWVPFLLGVMCIYPNMYLFVACMMVIISGVRLEHNE